MEKETCFLGFLHFAFFTSRVYFSPNSAYCNLITKVFLVDLFSNILIDIFSFYVNV